MTRQQLFGAFFFVVLLFLLSQLYALFAFFLKPLAWTIILVLTFYPLYDFLQDILRGRRALASLLLTTFIILLIAVPIFLLSSVLTSQMVDLYQKLQEVVQSGQLQSYFAGWQETYLGKLWLKWVPQTAASNIDIPGLLLIAVNTISQFILSHVTDVAKNLAVLMFHFSIVSFTLFFLFRDGEALYSTLRDLIPMETYHKDEIFRQFYETVSAVVQGMVVTALIQGLLAGIGFAATGVPYVFVLSCLSALASLQPFGGAAVVWLPCALYLGFTGSWGWAIGLIVYGVVFISGIDNIIKPYIIGERTKLPTLFLFLGILGGLQAYGFLGVFLGPVVLATIMAFVSIYRKEYAHDVATP
jgi:predicted PurR-regulated permease PerM